MSRVHIVLIEEHFSGEKPTGLPTVQADAAGSGVVSQAGGVGLVETIRACGVDRLLSQALMPWRKPMAVHDPAKVLLDLAVSLANGGDCLADVAVLRAEPGVYGPVGSDPTVSRTIGALAADAPRALAVISVARVQATGLAHRAAVVLLRRVRSAGHQRGAAAADPRPGGSPPTTATGRPAPAPWVAELTGLLDLTSWPTSMRVIVRKERPHPGGAQLRFTDADGLRVTAFATNTARGQLADLELRHRRRARCEDRIGAAKDTGLMKLPLHAVNQNRIWCALASFACEIRAWLQMLILAGT